MQEIAVDVSRMAVREASVIAPNAHPIVLRPPQYAVVWDITPQNRIVLMKPYRTFTPIGTSAQPLQRSTMDNGVKSRIKNLYVAHGLHHVAVPAIFVAYRNHPQFSLLPLYHRHLILHRRVARRLALLALDSIPERPCLDTLTVLRPKRWFNGLLPIADANSTPDGDWCCIVDSGSIPHQQHLNTA
jgi:hypothetical protein